MEINTIIERLNDPDRYMDASDDAIRYIEELQAENERLRKVVGVSQKMLTGYCQHGYDTSRSARGCDECAKEIEQALKGE